MRARKLDAASYRLLQCCRACDVRQGGPPWRL